MSDSHGRTKPVRRAVELLEDAGAEVLIHCGDVGGLEVLEELAGRPCWFVWGNTDYPDPTWRAQVQALGMRWPEGPVELSLEQRRIAIFHGHESAFARAIGEGTQDYILHGHTHRRSDTRVRRTRVINPGALHRVGVKTVALLDLERDELDFIEVDGV